MKFKIKSNGYKNLHSKDSSKNASAPINPFELKYSRPKHTVLNRKIKGVSGNPSLTRKKSLEIRQKTLLVEMKQKNRDSALLDKRFGEKDTSMSVEDKMLERFMKEKAKNSKSMHSQNYNLEDELTHMGHSLANEDGQNAFYDAGFERVDDEDQDKGYLAKNVVKQLHFGGFDNDSKEQSQHKKSRHEVYQEIIAKSKQHKYERQMMKEQDEELIKQVDSELPEIQALLSSKRKDPNLPSFLTGANAEPMPRRSNQDDDYDRFVKEMIYEKRAKPVDRIKTDQELALEEKQKLEELEVTF